MSSVEKKWLKAHPKIRIAGPKSFPPFHFYDENSKAIGICSDYFELIAESLGIEFIVEVPQPWQKVLDKISQRKIDVISCIAYAKDREPYLQFSKPYLSFPLVIVTRNDSPFIGGVRDLNQKKVAAIKGNVTTGRLMGDGIIFTPYFVSSPLEGLEKVSFGQADAQIENLATATYLIRKNGLANLKIAAPTPYKDYRLYIGVRNDWPQLTEIINKSLKNITLEQRSAVMNKWLSVRYEYGISKIQVLKWVIVFCLFFTAIIVVVVMWNRRLQKEIKNRQVAETKLKESESRFREIIEDVSGIAIQGYDEQRKVTFWNKASEDLYRFTKEEALGQKLEDLIIPDDMKNRVIAFHKNWIEKGIKIPAGELLLVDKNRQPVPVYSSHVMHQASFGKEMFCIDLDLKPIKEAHKAFEKSELKYRHLFDNAPAGMYEVDFTKGRFVSVNEIMCRYTGFTQEELLSMDPLTLMAPESRERYLGRLEKFLSGKEVEDPVIDYTIKTKSGEKLTVMLNSEYIYENGSIKGAQVVVQDITEIKKAQKEKIKAQKIANEQNKMALVGQIAGKMAHDFNNILSIILGTTELSLLDCSEPEIKRSLELILEQALRGKNMTKNLVIFAKDHEPRQEYFYIQDKINLILDLLKKDLKDIELDVNNSPDIPKILADPGMLEHALINLVQNSIHALSKTQLPKIKIQAWYEKDYFCLRIEDNGCGIPKEFLDRIYEPSFTLKGSCDITQSYQPGIKGTGYGMSNVKKYIEQHNGQIKLESEMGKGTKFTIRLPRVKEELTRQEIIELTKEIQFSEKKILLVEDEKPVSDIQSKILSHDPCNHEVHVAANAKTALELFEKEKFDLVSLDYILPGEMNGLDIYQEIRKKDSEIPVLFISGNIEFLESIKKLKQKDPFIDHLSKPCLNQDYIRRINDLFERVLLHKIKH